jgi:hypothetical protein
LLFTVGYESKSCKRRLLDGGLPPWSRSDAKQLELVDRYPLAPPCFGDDVIPCLGSHPPRIGAHFYFIHLGISVNLHNKNDFLSLGSARYIGDDLNWPLGFEPE